LLDYGFEHYAAADLLPRNQVCGTVKVKTGTAKEVAAVLPDGLNTIYLKREGILSPRIGCLLFHFVGYSQSKVTSLLFVRGVV
jgi:hypothetical protein